jgi:hypothetical protein
MTMNEKGQWPRTDCIPKRGRGAWEITKEGRGQLKSRRQSMAPTPVLQREGKPGKPGDQN